jgi:glutathione peroxidase
MTHEAGFALDSEEGFMFRAMVWPLAAVVAGSVATVSAREKAAAVPDVLAFTVKSLDGRKVDLSRYRGKVLLIVNVASRCGYTPQYEQLQALHEKYGSQGLAVLGFPCNQFGAQEPGTADQIAAFCRTRFGVGFDMFAKVEVNGPGACGLYKKLTAEHTAPKGPGKIAWNFEKFLVSRQGQVVARFPSATAPDAPELVNRIETELARR